MVTLVDETACDLPMMDFDPFGHAFQYKAPGEHGDFDIVFMGKDGQSGGDGVNADYGNWQ